MIRNQISGIFVFCDQLHFFFFFYFYFFFFFFSLAEVDFSGVKTKILVEAFDGMSSSEDPGDSVEDPSEALSLLLLRLKSSETLAKNILARHRRSRENAGALSRLLTGAARKMDEVEALLADADRVVGESEKGKVVAQKPRANAQSKRHRKEKPLVEPSVQAILSASEDHQNDADLNSESDAEENVVEKTAPKKKRKKVISDAAAGRTGDGTLVFFSLNAERVGKMWSCPSVDGNELQVVRSQLNCIDFADLVGDQRIWYLSRLEEEILRRFRVNFPVLFRSQGFEMTMARESLIRDNDSVNGLIDTLASRVQELQVSSKQSPSLSAANNTALMISAKLHEQLSSVGEQGWYRQWLEQVQSLCQRCQLSFTTLERYQKAGELMLRCQVLTCLLPSFVQQLEIPIGMLLDTEDSKIRLAAAFEDQMQDFGGGNGGREIELLPESPPVPPPPLPVIEFPNTGVRKRPVRGKTCQRCSSNRIKCHSCKPLFCWKCDGYHEALPEPPLVYPGGDIPIKIYMFCKTHVDKYELINDTYSRYLTSVEHDPLTLPCWIQTVQVVEAAAMVQIFSAEDCQFNVVPIAPDGWCIFGCVARATNTDLHGLILELKHFLETTDMQDVIVEDFEEIMDLFRALDPGNSDSVQDLWSGGGGDLLIAVLAKFLNSNGSFRIVDWMITDGRLQRGHYVYPDGGQYENTINLLLNNQVLPHYDLLVAK